MVVVVLDPPWLKGVYQRRIHEGAHNIFSQLVLAEGAVTAVMAHHKELWYPEKLQHLTAFTMTPPDAVDIAGALTKIC